MKKRKVLLFVTSLILCVVVTLSGCKNNYTITYENTNGSLISFNVHRNRFIR